MIVVDIEGNGLLDTIDTVWCICAKAPATDVTFAHPPDDLEFALLILDDYDTIIGHNFIGYDLPALKKVLGYDYNGKVIDTMILSQLLFPERPGGHSLAAWGERLGYPKVEHEDWSKFTPEMLHRCKVDVELTALVYEALCNEAGETFDGVPIVHYNMAPIAKAEAQRQSGEVLTAMGEVVEYE